MPENPFDELLREFRDAYAKYGPEVFFLSGVTGAEYDADREKLDEYTGFLGFVSLGECDAAGVTPGYYILGPLYRNQWGRWTERWEEPFNCFNELAARAGASLPLAVRDQIPYPPADPVSWWLAYMWWQNPPSEEALTPPNGVTKEHRGIWFEPFLDAATAIERGGLCTPTAPVDRPAPAGDPPKLSGGATHSPDFTSVVWYGKRYTFSKGNQAEAVRALHEAWKEGEHSLTQETIGKRVESSANRFVLAKTFRQRKADGGYEPHPAWGTMIRPDSKGSYRLVPPESAQSPNNPHNPQIIPVCAPV